MTHAGRFVLGWAVAYALLFVAIARWGLSMDVPSWMFQFLPEDALRERFFQSIWHLHAQPPLMNALVGVAIQLERIGGPATENTLLAAHLGIGLAIVTAFASLSARILRRRWLAALAVVALLADPGFWLALFQAFYPIYELLCLVLLAASAHRFFAAGSVRWFGACCAAACALVLTRSLFHPLWAVLVLAWVGRGAWRRRTVRAWGIAALVVLAAWPTKNLIQFAFFGTSSWLGHHLARGLDVERPAVAVGFELGDAPEQLAARALAEEHVPQRYRSIAVLAEATKSTAGPQVPNLNHFAMLESSRTLRDRALAAIAADPAVLLQRAALWYRRGLCCTRRATSTPASSTRGSVPDGCVPGRGCTRRSPCRNSTATSAARLRTAFASCCRSRSCWSSFASSDSVSGMLTGGPWHSCSRRRSGCSR